MTIYYPDISSFQGDISLQGALAVACKVTQGTGYVNPYYSSRQAEAAHQGAFFMAYHFLQEGNAAAQAAWAYSHAGKTPLMLDFEPSPAIGSAPKIADAEAFIDAYRKAGGTCNLLYLGNWYWKQLGSPDLSGFRSRNMALVSANYSAPYTDAGSGAGWQPYGGMIPQVWQYTDRLHFNGASVDFNAYRGSYAGKQDAASVQACLAEFKALALGGSVPPPQAGGPYRHVAPEVKGESLGKVADDRHTTVESIVATSAGQLSPEHLNVLRAYAALEDAMTAAGMSRPTMPGGLVYWTLSP